MKKLHFLGMICLTALFLGAVVCCSEKETNGNTGNGNGVPNSDGSFGDYVDLGLPSGTMWKNHNQTNPADAEYDFFTYDEAVATFRSELPTKEQCQELIDRCQWSWLGWGSGYKVTGPNGNSIVLPAEGSRPPIGEVYDVGSFGAYWTSTSEDSDCAWYMYFGNGGVSMSPFCNRDAGLSVRLVLH